MSEVRLIANDGKHINVDFEIIKASTYLSKTLERDPEHASIEISECASNILELVIEYIKLTLKAEPKPVPDVLNVSSLKEDLDDDFFFDFIDQVDLETAFQLINAALLFEFVHLHDLACAKIASFMKGKTLEEINKEFTIECQLTAEDAKTIGLEVDEQQS